MINIIVFWFVPSVSPCDSIMEALWLTSPCVYHCAVMIYYRVTPIVSAAIFATLTMQTYRLRLKGLTVLSVLQWLKISILPTSYAILMQVYPEMTEQTAMIIYYSIFVIVLFGYREKINSKAAKALINAKRA